MSIVVDGNTFTIIKSNKSINIEVFDIHNNTYETCITEEYLKYYIRYADFYNIIMSCLEKKINYSMELKYIGKELIITFIKKIMKNEEFTIKKSIVFSPKSI